MRPFQSERSARAPVDTGESSRSRRADKARREQRHSARLHQRVTLRAKRLRNDSFDTVWPAAGAEVGDRDRRRAGGLAGDVLRTRRARATTTTRFAFAALARRGIRVARRRAAAAFGSRGGRGAAFGSRGGRGVPDDDADDEPSRRGPRDDDASRRRDAGRNPGHRDRHCHRFFGPRPLASSSARASRKMSAIASSFSPSGAEHALARRARNRGQQLRW